MGICIRRLTEKKLLECFMEKELQKTNQMDFRIEKVIKRKGDYSQINWEGYIICLIAGQTRKI